MEKNRDKTPLHGKDLEVQYIDLLSKSKLIESDFKKEILELRILYQSEKEKSSSLENSIKNYPSKVSALELQLKEEITLRKSLESKLQEYAKDAQKRSDDKELERYQQACTQLQTENRSLNQQYLSILEDKKELQDKLTEYIDFLNKRNEKLREDHEKMIGDIRLEENQIRTQEIKELQTEIEHLNSQLKKKNKQVLRISQKYQDSKEFQLNIAAEVDRKEYLIQQLRKENQELLGKSQATDTEISNKLEDMSSYLKRVKTENSLLKNKIRFKKNKSFKKKEGFIHEIEDMNSKLDLVERDKKRLDSETGILRSKINEQAQTIIDLQNKLKESEEVHNEIKKQTKQSIEPVVRKLRTERDNFKAELREVRKSIDFSNVPDFGPSLYDELSSLNDQTPESLEIELSKISEEKEELQAEINSLHSKLSYKTAIVSNLESEINKLKNQQIPVKDLQKRLNEYKEEINKLRSQIVQKDKLVKHLQDEISKLQGEIFRLRHIESELKQKEISISETQEKILDLQKEIELLRTVNTKIMQTEQAIASIPSTETSANIPDYNTNSGNSFRPSHAEKFNRDINRLQSQLSEKEYTISELKKEKKELQKLAGSTGIAAMLKLESERDMLKSEILRLDTQLQLSNHEWTVYSRQLRDELEKEQRERIALLEMGSNRVVLNQSLSVKNSWWKRKFGKRSMW